MQNLNLETVNKTILKIFKKSEETLELIYNNIILKNIKIITISFLIISINFSIFKTLFVEGYPVDSYQYLAASYEKWIETGIKNNLIEEHAASQRIVFPLIIAMTHIFIPIDISLLACIINLIAALLSVFFLRKILRINEFAEDEIDFATLFVILSYNFLNYWFTILTDVVSLPFFMLMIYSLELFLKMREYYTFQRIFLISISLFAFLLAFLTREIYIFSIILYFAIIKKRKIRVIVFFVFSWFVFLLINLDPSGLTFAEHFFPPAAWEEFKLRNYFEVFAIIQEKWLIYNYPERFIKGLIKVGIIPALLIIILILILFTDWRQTKRRIFNPSTWKFSGNISLLIFWFLIYFLIYALLYYNIYFPTGLRYWLPISWILIAYVAKLMRKVKNYHLKFIIVFSLCFYPLTWSSIELYENRNVQTGTGPIYSQNQYFNDMMDLKSITNYDSRYITIDLINGSFFETTATAAAYENESIKGHSLSDFSFFIWENATINLTIEVRLYSPNNAYWGFEIYEVKSNFAPGHGRIKFARQYIGAASTFQVYNYTTNQSFLARWVTLTIGGGENSTIIWDYLKIIVK